MTLKSSLNIFRFHEKNESKKRKLNELMSSDNNINYLNGFEQQFNCNQNERTYIETNYESPSKRSRNTTNDEIMSSNIDFKTPINSNSNNKSSESKSLINTIFSKFWRKFKTGNNENKSNEESKQFVRNDDNSVNRLSFGSNSSDSSELNRFRNDLNYSSNNTNFNNNGMNQNILSQIKNQNIRLNESSINSEPNPHRNYVNNKSETVLSKTLSTNKSENNMKCKKRKLLNSMRLEDRERYKSLLESHLSQSNSKFSSIKSLNTGFNKFKKQEVIDLTSSVSSTQNNTFNGNVFSKSSHSRHSLGEGISSEKLDNRTKNNLVERIRSAGIVAHTFDQNNSTQFESKVSHNNSLSLVSNNSFARDSQSVIETTQIPESSKIFKDLLVDKKQLLESQWIQDLRNSLTESHEKFENKLSESQRKVSETKDKRQNDYKNLGNLIRVPFTRSELSFVPFCQLEDKQLDDIFEEEEDEGLEEDTIAKDLPILTPEMDKMIDEALRPMPSDEVLVEAFSLTISRKDMETLSGLNWLNDEVINFYMSLIVERGKNDNFSTSYAFNTFFYPKLISGGHKVLKRWTRKVDIFANELILIPVHLGVHWCLAVIDFPNKKINYYDSMGGKNIECIQKLKTYIQEESLDKKKKEYNMTDWDLVIVKDIPQQMNGSDCGMFTCKYAEYISRRAEINFSQAQMPYFRRRMVYEILTKKLL